MAAVIVSSENRGIDFKKEPPDAKADVQRKDGKWKGCNLRQAGVEGRDCFSIRRFLEAGRLDCFSLPPPPPTLVLQFDRPKSDFQQARGCLSLLLNVPAGITGGIDGSLWIIKPEMGGGGDRQVFHLSLTWK